MFEIHKDHLKALDHCQSKEQSREGKGRGGEGWGGVGRVWGGPVDEQSRNI
jgi:hypothetical protein